MRPNLVTAPEPLEHALACPRLGVLAFWRMPGRGLWCDEAQKAETGPVFNKTWFMMVGGLEYWS
jgi:hypothetical protein